jgi:hypothetical protein
MTNRELHRQFAHVAQLLLTAYEDMVRFKAMMQDHNPEIVETARLLHEEAETRYAKALVSACDTMLAVQPIWEEDGKDVA